MAKRPRIFATEDAVQMAKRRLPRMIFDFIEFYFNKVSFSFSANIFDKYSYFLKRISDTKRFNLDEETLFTEFKDDILNG